MIYEANQTWANIELHRFMFFFNILNTFWGTQTQRVAVHVLSAVCGVDLAYKTKQK